MSSNLPETTKFFRFANRPGRSFHIHSEISQAFKRRESGSVLLIPPVMRRIAHELRQTFSAARILGEPETDSSHYGTNGHPSRTLKAERLWPERETASYKEAAFMKTAERTLSMTVKLIFAIGLAGLLMGCTTSKRGSTGSPILTKKESPGSGITNSGLRDYREILSDPGPF